MPKKPFAIYHEHPDWFRPLFAELERRDIPFVRLDPRAHLFDPAETESPYSLVFNRMSPSAYLRGGVQGMFFTVAYLAHLERLGVRFDADRRGRLSLGLEGGHSVRRIVHAGAPADAATHAALKAVFGPRLHIAQLDGRWVALPL